MPRRTGALRKSYPDRRNNANSQQPHAGRLPRGGAGAYNLGFGGRPRTAARPARATYVIRELIDNGALEDFVTGLARCSGLCVAIYDPRRRRAVAATPDDSPASDCTPPELSSSLAFRPLAAPEPPAALAIVEHGADAHLAAEISTPGGLVGYVTVGPFRTTQVPRPAQRSASSASDTGNGLATSDAPSQCPPTLDTRPESRGVRIVRWAARMLSYWCRNELRLDTMSEELTLVGDIGELLAGQADLQTVLDRITRETARVMNCKYSSLRLYDPQTGAMRIASAFNLSQRYKDRGVVMRSESPIDDQALDGELVYIEDAQTDPRIRFRAEARKLGIHSGLTAGLFHDGRPLGVLRVYSDRIRRFGAAHRHLLRAVASQAATAIDNARRMEERLRAAEMERQLALAGEVQSRMMRVPVPEHTHVDAAMIFEPSWHLGGDFCDLFMLPDQRLVAVVGDVVGHGPAAALLMATTRAALRAGAQTTSDLGELLMRLNRQLCRDTTPAEFITLIAAAVDRDGRKLSYASAGHDPLMLLRGREVLQPDAGELVLGLEPDVVYREHSLPLKPGDFILLYTDGVVEAMNFRDKQFGRRRLCKLVKRYGRLPPRQALRNMHWDVRRFVGLAEQLDDQTMVALRVRERPSA